MILCWSYDIVYDYILLHRIFDSLTRLLYYIDNICKKKLYYYIHIIYIGYIIWLQYIKIYYNILFIGLYQDFDYCDKN